MIKKVTLAAITVMVFGISTQAFAVDEPANIIKYRQAVMKAIGAHTGAIIGVVKGEVSFTSHVEAHARSINAMSKLIPEMFPEGTGQEELGNTRALPEIWQNWDKFKTAAKALETESAKLIEVSAGGDVAAIGAQLGNVGKACGGCHKPFRAEKQSLLQPAQ